MKSAGPVRLVFVLIAITWTSALPTKETTTRRYNFPDGHNTNNYTQLGTSNTETNHTNTIGESSRKLYHYNTTFSRFRNNSLKINGIKKIVQHSLTKQAVNNNKVVLSTTTKAPKVIQTFNKSKPLKGSTGEDIIIVDFFKNVFEDLNTPNKTLKIVRLNKTSTLHSVKNVKKTVTVTTVRPLRKVTIPRRRLSTNSNSLKFKKGTTVRPVSNVKKENKNWPNTGIKNKQDFNRYKNYTQLNSNTKKKKRKPIIHKVVSKWSDEPPYGNFKQSWYDHGIPIPHPRPEISTYSPSYPINGVSIDSTDEDYYDDFDEVPAENPIQQMALDINPEKDQLSQYSGNDPKCPSVHLTNSVYGPTTKQGCSDLNIAINTHVHQNTVNDRFPGTLEDDPLEAANSAETSEVVSPPRPADVPAAAVEAPAVPVETAANAGGGTVNSGATGGSQGGGLPSLPGLPEFGFPDLSQIFEILGVLRGLWDALGNIFRFLRFLSPLLWIVPLASFGLGFLSILPLFPWWLPLLLLFIGKKKQPPPPEIVLHHHPSTSVHHSDGWFWNHNTKTWSNVLDYTHHERSINDDSIDRLSGVVSRLIDISSAKYKDDSQKSQSWKRRKK